MQHQHSAQCVCCRCVCCCFSSWGRYLDNWWAADVSHAISRLTSSDVYFVPMGGGREGMRWLNEKSHNKTPSLRAVDITDWQTRRGGGTPGSEDECSGIKQRKKTLTISIPIVEGWCCPMFDWSNSHEVELVCMWVAQWSQLRGGGEEKQLWYGWKRRLAGLCFLNTVLAWGEKFMSCV